MCYRRGNLSHFNSKYEYFIQYLAEASVSTGTTIAEYKINAFKFNCSVPCFVNRPHFRCAHQCLSFALDWSAGIRHQPFHRFMKTILICCQRKMLRRGQVMKLFPHSAHHHLIRDAIGLRAGSIPPTGAFLGSLLAGFLLQYVGRKNTIIIASPLATIGWILIGTATGLEAILLGRFITGFCVGLCLPSVQIYVYEKKPIT